jgi:hypothetical protein
MGERSGVTGRSLMTARAVLRLLHLMAHRPEGVEPDTVADYLGKSRSTATNLLNTLCCEGFAHHDGSSARYLLVDSRWVPEDPAHCGNVTTSLNESTPDARVQHGTGSESHECECTGPVCWHLEPVPAAPE